MASLHGVVEMIQKLRKTFLCLVTLLVTSSASADLLVDAGQRAMLTVSVTIQGDVEQKKGIRDEVVKWSTKRSFEAKVEMVSEKPEKVSYSGSFDEQGGSPRAVLEDLQKQATECGQNQACQMRIALQMMNSPALRGAKDAAPRYQVWRAVKNGGLVEASGSHVESLHTVFYTAARETTDCTMTAPKVSPELINNDPGSEAQWAARSKEAVDSSARSFLIEVDSSDKKGVLTVTSFLTVGSGNIECVQNIGSGPETSQHSTSATLLPADNAEAPLKVPGIASDSEIFASGSASIKSNQKLNNLGVGFAVDVVAPLDIEVKWELKKF